MIYPVLASVVLLCLWGAVKYFGQEIINMIATIVFGLSGLGAVHNVSALAPCLDRI